MYKGIQITQAKLCKVTALAAVWHAIAGAAMLIISDLA